MFARAVGRFQANRRELEESHELVAFEPPETFSISIENQEACRQVLAALEMRATYQISLPDQHRGQEIAARLDTESADWDKLPAWKDEIHSNADGILMVASHAPQDLRTYEQFFNDRQKLLDIVHSGPLVSFSYQRLKLLEHRFDCYLQLNKIRETNQTKHDRMDWSKVAKVDTHIHLAAAFTSAQLFEFIERKLRHHGSDVVAQKDGKDLTLQEMFLACNIDPQNLNITALDTQADLSTFNRFDNFNSLYNPFGDASLRAVFMKSDNHMNGAYFAELTKSLLDDQEKPTSSNIKSEFRLSIYGRKASEWKSLADWVVQFNLFSDSNRYLIQIPRIYSVWRSMGAVKNFAELLDHIFKPLFEATLDPQNHKSMHQFLSQVTGFDCVDDESKVDAPMPRPEKSDPRLWDSDHNPPYAYWSYFVYAHIVSLNRLRKARGMHEFSFRPHCGEAGAVTHLADAFLLASSINHGIQLQKSMPLQYMYYLSQIGLAVSPLSNAALFLDYEKNPFPVFFKRGLNVSLSTDDPLQFSYTRYPLIEEYSVAKVRWNLSQVDLSELSANSVRQSGFDHRLKVQWLGPNYYRLGLAGNDVQYSNVPDLRVSYRTRCLADEMSFLERSSRGDFPVVKSESVVGMVPSVNVLFTKVSMMHHVAANPSPSLVKTLQAMEHAESCAVILSMIAARNKYYSPPDRRNGNFVDLDAAKSMPALSRRIALIAGVFRVLESELDLCAHCWDQLSQVKCVECEKSYCRECARVLHRAPALRHHSLVDLSEVVARASFTPFQEFVADMERMGQFAEDGPTNSMCRRRLKLLSTRYEAHVLLNGSTEKNSMKSCAKHFTNLVKVDNHCHTSSSMTAYHLLDFVQRMYHARKEVEVLPGKTLGQIVENVAPKGRVDEMTLDSLGMNDGETFGRFDKWNALYLPFQDDEMRQAFLRRENLDGGRLYSDLLKEVVAKKDPLVFTEFRLTVRGVSKTEWTDLARWILDSGLNQLSRNAWVIQIPRAYRKLKQEGLVSSMGQLLDNVFRPLFEVMLDPSTDPTLFEFLFQVSGFDSVDDESINDSPLDLCPADPAHWTQAAEPPYAYWMYFLRANISTLNSLRTERFIAPFSLRPHSGATGNVSHLCASYLLADSITHGLRLVAFPSLHYCFYLSQVGICMAPLAENALYCKIRDSPFYEYFKQGLVVSLSTDNPRAIHLTPEPLLEEYAICVQTWRLRSADQAELARNSVILSGFPDSTKEQWLGSRFFDTSPKGNVPAKSGISNVRAQYRSDCLSDERSFVAESAGQPLTSFQ